MCGCVRNQVWMCLFLYSRVLTSVQSRRVKHNLSYSGIMPSNKRNRIHWTNSYSMHMLRYVCSYVGVWLLSECPEYWEKTLWLKVPLCLWPSVHPFVCPPVYSVVNRLCNGVCNRYKTLSAVNYCYKHYEVYEFIFFLLWRYFFLSLSSLAIDFI